MKFLGLLLLITYVSAFPSGAPEEACEDLTPLHLVSPQTSPFPYTVEVTKDGDNYKVTLSATGDDVFRGFLMQARRGTDRTPIGKFEGFNNESTGLTCNGGTDNSATHANAVSKKSISVTWNPNGANTDNVQIFVSVVRLFDTFWVRFPASLP
ncbi:DgyrCDS10064 [Dimorphilus gyrociliatus]|uniref:DgyrCDS10064 n=1 Tax=Dimorphilus gyrociliatus TaxID=2664684 RepID=A0A7I8W0B3_9ANNE|nr:DgyrCDS10064 [Dimorphilus gyrociliatus]